VKRSESILLRIDKITVLLFLVMITMGWLNIYAAVYNEEHKGLMDISQRYGKQFVWILAAIVLAVFVVIIDNRFYFFFGYFLYGGAILILILVLVFGKEINGAKSWFEFGSINLQPSEFAKAGTALAIARYLNSKGQELTRIRTLLEASAIILLPAFLTALQPDMGSVIIYLAFYIVLFREGLSPYIFISGLLMVILFFITLLFNNLYLTLILIAIAFLLTWVATRKWKLCLAGLTILSVIAAILYLVDYIYLKRIGIELIIMISLILSGFAFAWYIYRQKAFAVLVMYLFLLGSILFVNTVDYTFNTILPAHQKERISILLGLKSDPYGTGYNVNQSIISIGSGGLSGKGFLQGTQTKFKFVPKQSSDFIFCTVGEEWGFFGAVLIIGLYTGLLLRLVFLAERQRSFFSRVFGYGVISIFVMHFFINIGMSIGLVPVIGIPLPFFSYGGSSLWGFTLLLFIFLRLDASRTEYLV
jgi:rod shape determining protein RodA